MLYIIGVNIILIICVKSILFQIPNFFLLVFYGLMTLLAAVVKDKPSPTTQQAAGTEAVIDRAEDDGQEETMLRAAAVAIVLARAEAGEGAGPPGLDAPGEAAAGQPVSPWWSLHHQRQITVSPDLRRSR